MELKDFCADQKQLVDDFRDWYESRRKRKGLTMIRPVSQWRELFLEFKEIYEDGNDQQQQQKDQRQREADDQRAA